MPSGWTYGRARCSRWWCVRRCRLAVGMPTGTRRLAVPQHRLIQRQRGPEEVERRNEQQYQHALNAVRSIDDERSILPEWRKQGWLDHQHPVALIAVQGRPWRHVAVTNAHRRALG